MGPDEISITKKMLAKVGTPVLSVASVSLMAIVVQSCSSYGREYEPPTGSLEEAQIPRLLMQICVPNQTVSYNVVEVDLSKQPVELTKFAKDDSPVDSRVSDKARKLTFDARPTDVDYGSIGYGQVRHFFANFSESMEHAYLYDTTELEQPVFETMFDGPQKLAAIHINAPNNRNGQGAEFLYWYKLPAKLSNEKFTQWQEPVAKSLRASFTPTSFEPWDYITHGRELPPYQPERSALKVRFRIMSYQDIGLKGLFWQRTYNALFYKYKNGLSDEEQNKLIYIKLADEPPIAGC